MHVFVQNMCKTNIRSHQCYFVSHTVSRDKVGTMNGLTGAKPYTKPFYQLFDPIIRTSDVSLVPNR